MTDVAPDLAAEAMKLMEAGELEAAAAAGERAIEAFQPLVEQEPAIHGPALANALQFQGVRFSMLGRSGEALSCCQAAIALRRELAEKHPDAFSDLQLAGGLNDAGVLLSALGELEDAVALGEEAVALWRAERAAPRLMAMGLSNLALRYAAVARHDDARRSCREVEVLLTGGDVPPEARMRFAGVHGSVLKTAGDAEASAKALQAGIVAALPALRAEPTVFGEFARMLLSDLDALGEVAAVDDERLTEARELCRPSD